VQILATSHIEILVRFSATPELSFQPVPELKLEPVLRLKLTKQKPLKLDSSQLKLGI